MTDTTNCAPLLERTLDLVRNAPRTVTYQMMADQCGVSVGWVSKFVNRHIENPGIVTVQCLHDYLSNVGK